LIVTSMPNLSGRSGDAAAEFDPHRRIEQPGPEPAFSRAKAFRSCSSSGFALRSRQEKTRCSALPGARSMRHRILKLAFV
jgi:hypothetical protein